MSDQPIISPREVRLVICPQCYAPAGTRCVGQQRTPLTYPHYPRIEAAIDVRDRAIDALREPSVQPDLSQAPE